MKDSKVRRFSVAEILTHWCNATVYMVLALTGSLLLLGRVLGTEVISHNTLGIVHRVAGVILVLLLSQAVLLSLAASNFRPLWATLRESLRWTRNDLLWLITVPLNAISKRVALPAAGRFNAGQKLHLLLIVTLLTGFSISGLAMILVPGALAAWIVHVICLIPAAVFLLLHLFLSLMNSETRKALPAIFTGFVTAEYAKQHHASWFGQDDKGHQASYISLKCVGIATIVMIAVVTALAGYRGFETTSSAIRTTIVQRGATAIMPGPLAKVHQTAKRGYSNCLHCHNSLSSPSSEKCLACHDTIGRRIAARSGYHGTLTGECRDCHKDHNGADASLVAFDSETFDHNKANFPLQGRHQITACWECHRPGDSTEQDASLKYIGLEYDRCTRCHANPHVDERSAECLQCHTMQGWTKGHLVFDHNRDSSFALNGEHSKAACSKCHKPRLAQTQTDVPLYDIGRLCKDCHEDPHLGQFAKDCEECHSEQGWKDRRLAAFHAPGSSFTLKGRHAELQCQECHKTDGTDDVLAKAQFAGLGEDCQSCHEDPHNAQFEQDCEHCHNEGGWTGRWLPAFHAPDSSFSLKGEHATLQCRQCHKPERQDSALAGAKFVGLGQDCESCHEDPHNSQMNATCSACHSEKGWSGSLLLFSHDTQSAFKLDDLHAPLPCASCHGDEEKTYTPLALECAECHQHEDRVMQGLSESITGESDPHFGRIACIDCHSVDGPRQEPQEYARRCAKCHGASYGKLYYSWAESLRMSRLEAEQRLQNIPDSQNEERVNLEERIHEATVIGFHNLDLAREMWNNIRKTQ